MKFGIKVLLLVIPAVLAFIFLFGGFWAFFTWSPEKSDRILARAIQEHNPKLCERLPESIPDTLPRSMCYEDYATATGEIQYCTDIFCYNAVVLQKRDPSLCLKVNERDWGAGSYDTYRCLAHYGSDTRSPAVCDMVQDHDYKIKCKIYVMDKIKQSTCSGSGDQSAIDKCYLNTLNETQCAELTSPILKDHCYADFSDVKNKQRTSIPI